jgi:hypothetical protein
MVTTPHNDSIQILLLHAAVSIDLGCQELRYIETVSRSSGKEPGSFWSVQLISVCPTVPSHLCSI